MAHVYHAEPFAPEEIRSSGRRQTTTSSQLISNVEKAPEIACEEQTKWSGWLPNASPQLTSNVEKMHEITSRNDPSPYGLKARRPSRQTIRPLAA